MQDDADRKAKPPYDDGDWTPEEMASLAWEAGKSIGWDEPEMDAYDEYEQHR